MVECERLMYASRRVVLRWKNARIRFKARNASLLVAVRRNPPPGKWVSGMFRG